MFNFDNIEIPEYENFSKGCRKFEEYEGRDPIYKVATFLISHYWGSYADMADALGILLLSWNQAFYRYHGSLDFEKLEKCIRNNFGRIESFRGRDISTLSESDEQNIQELFNDFFEATMANSKNKKTKSPVSVAKALHLLAPRFFPLWDQSISKAYKQDYSYKPEEKYINFCKITKHIAEQVKNYDIHSENKTLVKQIDEYNYSKYTKKLIK